MDSAYRSEFYIVSDYSGIFAAGTLTQNISFTEFKIGKKTIFPSVDFKGTVCDWAYVIMKLIVYLYSSLIS